MPPSEPMRLEASIGISTTLALDAVPIAAMGFGVFLRDEIVDGVDVAGSDGFGDEPRCLGFCLGKSFSCFRFPIGGLALAFRLQDGGLLGALGAQDLCIPEALGFQHLGTLFALGLHLARHGIHQILGRLDVLDLDAGDP